MARIQAVAAAHVCIDCCHHQPQDAAFPFHGMYSGSCTSAPLDMHAATALPPCIGSRCS